MKSSLLLFPLRLALGLTALLLCTPDLAFAAPEAGRVITLTPGVTVQRGGQTLPLKMQDIVEPGDTLRTDATGRVRVLFSDDGSIALGSNTVFTLEKYVAEGSKANFTGRMAKGLLRSITGKIVEQNPEGFKLLTPEATVGIRGTILSVRSLNGFTTVYVENTLRQVYVNNINVPNLNKITVPGTPLRPEPLMPQDRREIGRGLAFLGGNGSAAAAPEPGNDAGTTATNNLTARSNTLPSTSALNDLAVADMTTPAMPPLAPTTATVQGTLAPVQMSPLTASAFSFNVNLGSGAIYNAAMYAYGFDYLTPISFTVSGGAGSLSGGTFAITGFTGTAYPASGVPVTVIPTDPTKMAGTADVSSIGGVTTGTFDVIQGATTYFDGPLSGTRTQ
ncbi:MAG: FecR family protein [Desulfovibrio sp.]|jgi:hypothetical protein|nr:FecR family protein [Desulfovibrio sp.]